MCAYTQGKHFSDWQTMWLRMPTSQNPPLCMAHLKWDFVISRFRDDAYFRYLITEEPTGKEGGLNYMTGKSRWSTWRGQI